MNILITGGAGFIGSSMANHLIKLGHSVTILDNLSPQIHGSDPEKSALVLALPQTARLIKGDVRSRSDWLNALNGQDCVLHLAAETGTGQSMYEVDHYVEVNIKGTSILLDIIAKGERKINKIVVASSRSIYGEGKYKSSFGYVYPESRLLSDMENGIFDCISQETGEILEVTATDEESKLHPTSIYGITKLVQEQLILTTCKSLGIGCAALRYQNVYGPGQSLRNPYTGILSIFSTLLLQGRDLNVFEDGMESRDFVYIDDVVDATTKAIESEGISGKAYNVGAGVKTTVLEVAETLKRIYNAKGNIIISNNFRIGDIRHNYADLTLIQNDLKFSPKVDFEEGINRFSKWVNNQIIEDAGYDKSIKEMKDRGLLK